MGNVYAGRLNPKRKTKGVILTLQNNRVDSDPGGVKYWALAEL